MELSNYITIGVPLVGFFVGMWVMINRIQVYTELHKKQIKDTNERISAHEQICREDKITQAASIKTDLKDLHKRIDEIPSQISVLLRR